MQHSQSEIIEKALEILRQTPHQLTRRDEKTVEVRLPYKNEQGDIFMYVYKVLFTRIGATQHFEWKFLDVSDFDVQLIKPNI